MTEPKLNKILVLFAHPVFQTSLLNRSLLDTLDKHHQITIHDLYECYPNFMIDVEFEQKLLLQHDVVIFQHPLYWYSSPAILKEWMDLVLEHGFAYGTGATALRGKKFISVISTGGDFDNYRDELNIRDFLKPFEYTAKLCNMEFIPPFVTYAGLKIKAKNFSGHLTADYLSHQTKKYLQLMDDLLHNRIDAESCRAYKTINDYYDRAPHD